MNIPHIKFKCRSYCGRCLLTCSLVNTLQLIYLIVLKGLEKRVQVFELLPDEKMADSTSDPCCRLVVKVVAFPLFHLPDLQRVRFQATNGCVVCSNCRSGLLNGSARARDYNGYLDDNRRAAVAQKLLDLSSATFDLQSVVSMEILESDLAYVEARNEEVSTLQ